MLFENLTISRIIIHEVFRRADDRNKIPPRYGEALVELDQEALDALRERITSAMGSASRSFEMGIVDVGAASALAIARQLVDADDTNFVRYSKDLANKLTDVQTRRDLPGGILIVFSGSVGYPARRFIGIIKAEPHSGFTRQTRKDSTLWLQFLKELILTPQAKLYKIGIFVEADQEVAAADPLPGGWRAFIYDDHMSAANRLGAAQYFYEGFFGCAFPETSAKRTREFHDFTKEFIQELPLPEEKKIDLHNALITYLKVDQSPTVEVGVFAQTYLPEPAMRDAYTQFMQAKEFPLNAVYKDLTNVTGALRFRKVVFSSDIKLIAPAEKFTQMVSMRIIDGTPDQNGQTPKWTEIIVRDRIRAQE